jgi:hypothetical protein
VRINAARCEGCGAGTFMARSFTKESDKGHYGEVTSARLTAGVASLTSGFVPTPATGVDTSHQPSIYDRDYAAR